MNKTPAQRLQYVTPEQFKALMAAKAIRPASLDDVLGTHHTRNLYRHPMTDQYYTATTSNEAQ